MSKYTVARFGSEWFVIHSHIEQVVARCDNEYAARGIAHFGNGTESRDEQAPTDEGEQEVRRDG